MRGKWSKNSGFTLVEIIIVIAILVTLGAAVGLSVMRYTEKARKTLVLNEAKMVFDQCSFSIAGFDGVMWKGKEVNLASGLNKTDPVFGQCGRISNLSCYNEMGAKNISTVTGEASFVDQYMAKGICETLSTFSMNDYGSASPNNMYVKDLATDSRFANKFDFICCYNAEGCLYVEVYHRGYFVHFNGHNNLNDVLNCREHPEVKFSDVH